MFSLIAALVSYRRQVAASARIVTPVQTRDVANDVVDTGRLARAA